MVEMRQFFEKGRLRERPNPWILRGILLSALLQCACLWDYDTIEMERQQFPDTYELIVGKFLRHSPKFYQWRVKDREQRIALAPDSLPLYDDLAVAYSKLHNNQAAIRVILAKDSIRPGLYETYANLGTFYLHDGQLRRGITYIQKAIEINPDAHFGREVYQKYLAEYLLSKFPDEKIHVPVNKEKDDYFGEVECNNFYTFLRKQHNKKRKEPSNHLTADEFDKALKGVLGMMKFGNFDSPVLLEALGDLLSHAVQKPMHKDDYGGSYTYSARNLAARAYLKASWATKDAGAKKIYEEKAWNILEMDKIADDYSARGKLGVYQELISTSLRTSVAEADQFYQRIKANEERWIAQGKNPEYAFDQMYYHQVVAGPERRVPDDPEWATSAKPDQANHDPASPGQPFPYVSAVLGLLVALGVVGVAFWRFYR
jgi:tetratricopeptide (TPR) repeat protein